MDLNSSRFSSLIVASSVFSFWSSCFSPLSFRTTSTSSVRERFSLFVLRVFISFLNSNSFPLSMASKSVLFSCLAFSTRLFMIFSPIFRFGVFITLSRLTSSWGLFINLR